MRRLLAYALLLVVNAAAWAQTDKSASVRSLSFLQGVWTAADNGYPAETTEFHWRQSQANLFLVGHSWLGMESGCPWCVTQTAMAFWYDPAPGQIRLHLTDTAQHALDLHLVSAGERSLQFLTDRQIGMPVYRLTYTSKSGVLSANLEKAESDAGNVFVSVAQLRFHRR